MAVSTVNVAIPIYLPFDDTDAAPTMFALSHWLLPRVPCVGEQIVVEALQRRMEVEDVIWNSAGRAIVNLKAARLEAQGLEDLELDGWRLAPSKDEPPSEWLTG